MEKNSCAGERLSDSDEDHDGDDNSEIVRVDDDFTDDFDGYWRNPDETEDSEPSLQKTALIDMISNVQSSDQVPADINTVKEGNYPSEGVKVKTPLWGGPVSGKAFQD